MKVQVLPTNRGLEGEGGGSGNTTDLMGLGTRTTDVQMDALSMDIWDNQLHFFNAQ